MRRDEIPTPALLLDLDRFERNLARMATRYGSTHGDGYWYFQRNLRPPTLSRTSFFSG